MADVPKTQWGITPPISDAPATESDIALNQEMIDELKRQNSFEAAEESHKRVQVLSQLQKIAEDFVKTVYTNKQMSETAIKNAGGKIFTFGSYRLGVYGPGSDIDTLLVCPSQVSRTDFFEHLPRMLYEQPTVTELSPVLDAFVPIIKFKFNSISIDLIFARLNLNSVPKDLTLTDNNLLRGMDEVNLRCLNGTRVTDEILELVPKPAVFKTALRAIKLWAQRRAVYANVMGFPGGVAWAMLVARICQLYPQAVGAVIISKFFKILSQWSWPQPVLLKQIEEGPLSVRVWNPKIYPGDRHHLMPIITPAYPSMCATHNITVSTKEIIMRELRAAGDLVDKIFAKQENWSALFQKHSFFTSGYKYYLSVVAASKSKETQLSWGGLVESKLRHLVLKLETLDSIKLAHPFNKGFENVLYCKDEDEAHRVARGEFLKPGNKLGLQSNLETVVEGAEEGATKQEPIVIYTTTYYVGLEIDAETKRIDVSWPTEEFYSMCRSSPSFNEDVSSIHICLTKNFELPDDVFDAKLGEKRPERLRKKKHLGIKRTSETAGLDEVRETLSRSPTPLEWKRRVLHAAPLPRAFMERRAPQTTQQADEDIASHVGQRLVV